MRGWLKNSKKILTEDEYSSILKLNLTWLSQRLLTNLANLIIHPTIKGLHKMKSYLLVFESTREWYLLNAPIKEVAMKYQDDTTLAQAMIPFWKVELDARPPLVRLDIGSGWPSAMMSGPLVENSNK